MTAFIDQRQQCRLTIWRYTRCHGFARGGARVIDFGWLEDDDRGACPVLRRRARPAAQAHLVIRSPIKVAAVSILNTAILAAGNGCFLELTP